MAAKSKTCTCGQSDTPANSSVDKNKKKIERLIGVQNVMKKCDFMSFIGQFCTL